VPLPCGLTPTDPHRRVPSQPKSLISATEQWPLRYTARSPLPTLVLEVRMRSTDAAIAALPVSAEARGKATEPGPDATTTSH